MGEILHEYRTTRFPDRFFHLKIGIPWADREHRLDAALVLGFCGDAPMREKDEGPCSMGVDTGRDLHAVVLRRDPDSDQQHLIHLAVCHEFGEFDAIIERFHVDRCVIDGLPETHATREFATRHPGVASMSFFNKNQRGAAKWDRSARSVVINRTEALDASRLAIREENVVLPRRDKTVEEFAVHMAADAKVLHEDDETGMKRYRYMRTGEDHFSLAFTYAWMAATDWSGHRGLMEYMRQKAKEAQGGPDYV